MVYEKIAPFMRAANVHRHQSAFLLADHDRIVATARRILDSILPDTVRADRELCEALDLLTSFEAWSRLRLEQGLNSRRAHETLELTVRRLIATAA